MIWAILFFVTGVLLIVSEFFLPGGVLGVIGGLLIVISGVLGVYAYPDYALFIIIGEALGAAVGILLGFWVISRTGMAKMLTQQHTFAAEDGYVSAESDMSLLGRSGVVLTALRPSGTITVDGKRVDAVSDGTFIDERSSVRVVQVHGSRVVVEPLEFQ